MTDLSGTTTYTYEPLTGRLQSKQTPQGTLSYTYDLAGNLKTTQSSNSGGASVTYTYDAFGNLLERTGSTPNNVLFAGEEFDPALGVYYNRARDYDLGNGSLRKWRRGWESNPRIKVLQTSPLPLGYRALIFTRYAKPLVARGDGKLYGAGDGI